MRIKIQIRMERANALRLALAFFCGTPIRIEALGWFRESEAETLSRKSWRSLEPLAFCHPADIRLLQPLFRTQFLFAVVTLRLWLRGGRLCLGSWIRLIWRSVIRMGWAGGRYHCLRISGSRFRTVFFSAGYIGGAFWSNRRRRNKSWWRCGAFAFLAVSGIPAWDKEGSSAFFDAASGDMPFTVSESEPPETSEDSSGEASFSSVAARSPLPESMALSFSKGSFSSAAQGLLLPWKRRLPLLELLLFVKFLSILLTTVAAY